MSYLLRRAAASAGLAVCGWSTLLLAQSTTVVVPDRTQMRRALPVAPAQAPPVVQQSPNGLYKLSITDTGIELRGPRGTVTIDNGGITIGGPGTPYVSIASNNMDVRVDQDATYSAGRNFNLKGGSYILIKSSGTAEVSGAVDAYLLGPGIALGCANATKPAARVGDQVNTTTSPAPTIAQGSPTVRVC